MKKLSVIFAAVVLSSVFCNAQVADSKCVIPENPSVFIPNLKYSELKKDYDFHAYKPAFNDKYNVGWCGFASAVIPGLGQAICNEWGSACCYFFGDILLGSIASSAIEMSYIDPDGEYQKDIVVAVVSLAALVGLDIWNVIDATRIAKTKDLYYRDACSSTKIGLKLQPSLAMAPAGPSGMQYAPGMSLKVSF